MYKQILAFVFLLSLIVLSSLVYADVNTRSIVSLDAELTISGNIGTTGNLHDMSLKVYIPQNGYSNVRVTPNTWRYTQDNLGNKMIMINWDNPSTSEAYEIKMDVHNDAEFSLPFFSCSC